MLDAGEAQARGVELNVAGDAFEVTGIGGTLAGDRHRLVAAVKHISAPPPPKVPRLGKSLQRHFRSNRGGSNAGGNPGIAVCGLQREALGGAVAGDSAGDHGAGAAAANRSGLPVSPRPLAGRAGGGIHENVRGDAGGDSRASRLRGRGVADCAAKAERGVTFISRLATCKYLDRDDVVAQVLVKLKVP